MSSERIIELINCLEDAGWLISCENEENSLFFVNSEKIEWLLFNTWNNSEVDLVFYLFDPLGNRTEKLSDILYVKDSKNATKLYFSKIDSKQWKTELKRFVRGLF